MVRHPNQLCLDACPLPHPTATATATIWEPKSNPIVDWRGKSRFDRTCSSSSSLTEASTKHFALGATDQVVHGEDSSSNCILPLSSGTCYSVLCEINTWLVGTSWFLPLSKVPHSLLVLILRLSVPRLLLLLLPSLLAVPMPPLPPRPAEEEGRKKFLHDEDRRLRFEIPRSSPLPTGAS